MSDIPIAVRLKSLLGIFCTTPFEDALLCRLSEALPEAERTVLESQLKRFNSVARLLEADDKSDAYGYVEFQTVRFGRVLWDYPLKFLEFPSEHKLATAKVKSNAGEMNVIFWVVKGVFFSIEFRSVENVFYPIGKFEITEFNVHISVAAQVTV